MTTIDLLRVSGFTALPLATQTRVLDIAAKKDQISKLDGSAGLSEIDLKLYADSVAPGAARDQAISFVKANAEAFGLRRPTGTGSTTTSSGTGVTSVRSIDDQLATMSTKDKVALLVMEYGHWRYPPKSGAIIVSSPHLTATTAPQLAETIANAEENKGFPLMVAADQEGGQVNRLCRLPGYQGVHFASPGEMQGWTLEQIIAEGKKVGKALKEAGINTLLGPVLDAADDGTLMAKQGRSFGNDPTEVTARAQAYIDGIRQANPGMIVIAKHYPGYNVRGNSDNNPVTDRSSAESITARLAPFHDVDGLDSVMMSSITYSAIDDQPACFSKKLIDGLRAARPDVVVMTDDLYARGLMSDELRGFVRYRELNGKAERSTAEQQELDRLLVRYPDLTNATHRAELTKDLRAHLVSASQKAFLAGNDLLLTMDGPSTAVVHQAIIDLVGASPEAAASLDVKVRRLLTMRAKLAPHNGAVIGDG